MRVLLMSMVALTACVGDRGMSRHFLVAVPQSSRRDSVRQDAIRVLDLVASKHGMKADSSKHCGAYYWGPADGAELTLCATFPSLDAVRVVVWEGFAVRWGPRGDSVQRELGDSLRALFGGRAVKG